MCDELYFQLKVQKQQNLETQIQYLKLKRDSDVPYCILGHCYRSLIK